MLTRICSSIALAACLAVLMPGCCCMCGGIPQPGPNVSGGGGGGADSSSGGTDEEFNMGWENAQKALTNLGYGEIYDAQLDKNGTKWTVSGQAGGLTDTTVNYAVMFNVFRSNNTLAWNVETVRIDGEQVYP